MKPRLGGRPSWWTKCDITSGLFSVFIRSVGALLPSLLVWFGVLYTEGHEGLVGFWDIDMVCHLAYRFFPWMFISTGFGCEMKGSEVKVE